VGWGATSSDGDDDEDEDEDEDENDRGEETGRNADAGVC
jgi:hypothetical protein